MFWRKLTNPIRRFFQRSKRLIQFIPIVWNSYDWDFIYATDLFKFQLLRMADYLDKYGKLENADYNVQRIRLVCRLMDKVYNGEYTSDAYDSLREKYGKEAMNIDFIPVDDELFKIESKYKNYPNSEEIEIDVRKTLDKSYEQTAKAHRLLWKLVEHNIQGWWD